MFVKIFSPGSDMDTFPSFLIKLKFMERKLCENSFDRHFSAFRNSMIIFSQLLKMQIHLVFSRYVDSDENH